MAQHRAAQNLAEFVKLATIGAAIFGKVVRKGQTGNGDFIVMSPAAFRASSTAPFTRYEELALGLSTDLLSKINDGDVGKILLAVYVATKPTQKSPMKLYNVWELSPAEAKGLLDGHDMPAEWTAPPAEASNAAQEEFPF